MDEHEIEDIRKQRKPEIDLLCRMAEAVNASKELVPGQEVSGSLAMVGHVYCPERALMIVGRAGNGAMAEEWLPSDPDPREQFIDQFINDVVQKFCGPSPKGYPCPMRWVTDQWGVKEARNVSDIWGRKGFKCAPYNTKKSAFWRVIKRVTEALDIAKDDAWPSHLVWSNLYKIAPAGGGNPSAPLRAAQFDCCAELLKTEIKSLKPKRILFSTGLEWDWADRFLTKLGVVRDKVCFDQKSKLVDAVGALDLPGQRIPIVVAKHPDRKKGDDWVQCVLDAFKVTG